MWHTNLKKKQEKKSFKMNLLKILVGYKMRHNMKLNCLVVIRVTEENDAAGAAAAADNDYDHDNDDDDNDDDYDDDNE
jgi:hypothetical protein